MPSDDRERTFENALASHLRAGSSAGVPGNSCADSEMLAAYHEGSLRPDQIASLKTHVPSCPRCQEILALLEATDQIPLALPDVPRAAAAATRSSVQVLPAPKSTRWLWIAPAGALAAALLVWVAVQQNNSIRVAKQAPSIDSKQTQIAKAQPASPSPSEGPSLATRKSETGPSVAEKNESLPDAFSALDATQPSQIDPTLRRRQKAFAKEKDSTNAPVRGTGGGSVGGIVGGVAGAMPKPPAPPAPGQDQKSIIPGAMSQTVRVESANPGIPATDAARSDAAQSELDEKSSNNKRAAVTSRPMAPAPAIGGAAAPPATAPPSAPSGVNTESAGLTDLPVQQREVTNLTAAGVTAGLRLANSVGAVTVSAPGGRVAWRIGQAGVVEFSSDAQKTWIVQPTGIIADLLAGSAPSAKICWIVGRTGTILRTTDAGKHWRKLNSPVQDDLRSVFAVDARQATISLPNASYQTTDGGATWTKLPPE
jgi:hypothetical protein